MRVRFIEKGENASCMWGSIEHSMRGVVKATLLFRTVVSCLLSEPNSPSLLPTAECVQRTRSKANT